MSGYEETETRQSGQAKSRSSEGDAATSTARSTGANSAQRPLAEGEKGAQDLLSDAQAFSALPGGPVDIEAQQNPYSDLDADLRVLARTCSDAEIDALRALLDEGVASLTTSSMAVFKDATDWVTDEFVAELKEFNSAAPGIGEQIFATVMGKAVAYPLDMAKEALGANPLGAVAVAVVDFGVGALQKQMDEQATKKVVDGQIDDTYTITRAYALLQNELLSTILSDGLVWLRQCERMLGWMKGSQGHITSLRDNIKRELTGRAMESDRIAAESDAGGKSLEDQVESQTKALQQKDALALDGVSRGKKTDVGLREQVQALKQEVVAIRDLAQEAAAKMSETASQILRDGRTLVSEYRKVFEFWRDAKTGLGKCPESGPVVSIFYDEASGQFVELSGDKVSRSEWPAIVSLWGEPVEPSPYQQHEAQNAGGRSVYWSEPTGALNPQGFRPVKHASGAQYVRLYVYRGLFVSDGGETLHMMQPMTPLTGHAMLDGGKIVAWDFDDRNDLLRKYIATHDHVDNALTRAWLNGAF